MEDLESRSWRSNLRCIGIPESLVAADLLMFLTTDLPKALAMDCPPDLHSIERAHHIGPQKPSGEGSPRPVISKYMDRPIGDRTHFTLERTNYFPGLFC